MLLLSGCLVEDDLKKPFATYTPVEIGDHWTLSNPSAENIDPEGLTEIYRDVHSDPDVWMIRSLLLFRNGRLVAESYMKDDEDRVDQHAIWSCTKQVVGILMGIALEKGFLTSLDDSIEKYLPDELKTHPEKKSITLRNLLTMQSGIDFDNDEHSDAFRCLKTDNSVEFVLSLPVNYNQGAYFHYNDGDPQLLSAILQKVSGRPADAWADEVLFSKIRLTNYHWHHYKDGITLGAFGLLMPPRELAKIAQCVLDGGSWGPNQVVNTQWINDMTSVKVRSTTDGKTYGFGYYWWIDEERGIYFMWGHGGQYAFVVPDTQLVVVITSEPNTQDEFQLGLEKALSIVDSIKSITY
jgi:CubicO group peptidase (beta-lactamase class C family)